MIFHLFLFKRAILCANFATTSTTSLRQKRTSHLFRSTLPC
ncbi:hypothetical protein [Moraxella lacunata]